jgi:uncharacterized protein YbaA (DUF1428 family)
MTYIDGFVCAVPDAKRDAYVKHAEEAARMFRDFGALRTVECWGDDVPDGKLTSFPMAVKKEPGESVIFSWIEWPSKQVRDEAWKKMMEDDRMKPEDMPFDGKRMIYGGFTAVLDA